MQKGLAALLRDGPLRALGNLLNIILRCETLTPAGKTNLAGAVLLIAGMAFLSIPATAGLLVCAYTGEIPLFLGSVKQALGAVFVFVSVCVLLVCSAEMDLIRRK